MRLFLLIVAAWASIAAATGLFLDQDATASFVIAILCLAGFFWLDYRAAQHAARTTNSCGGHWWFFWSRRRHVEQMIRQHVPPGFDPPPPDWKWKRP
jgi:hypothetical protein